MSAPHVELRGEWRFRRRWLVPVAAFVVRAAVRLVNAILGCVVVELRFEGQHWRRIRSPRAEVSVDLVGPQR